MINIVVPARCELVSARPAIGTCCYTASERNRGAGVLFNTKHTGLRFCLTCLLKKIYYCNIHLHLYSLPLCMILFRGGGACKKGLVVKNELESSLICTLSLPSSSVDEKERGNPRR